MKNEMPPLHPFFDEGKKTKKEERPVVKPFIREKGELYPGDEIILERIFQVGEEVKVENSDGKIAGGWN